VTHTLKIAWKRRALSAIAELLVAQLYQVTVLIAFTFSLASWKSII